VTEAIRREVFDIDGVRALHMLRSRRSGGDALIDLHIQVDPRISVSEGHQIGDTVRRQLLDRIEEVTDVTVHIDPEDDEQNSPCDKLPLRGDLIEALKLRWEHIEGVKADQVTLHYLDGKLQVELGLPLSMLEQTRDPERLVADIQEAAQALPEVDSVMVSFYAESP
jgi:hypothetical protein